jgi:hypothetical protein
MATLMPMANQRALIYRKVSTSWLIVTLLVLLISVCGAYLLRPSIRARYLLNELKTLQLGHSTFEDADWLARRIHAKPDPHGACDRSECMWSVAIDNARIPQWWRGSGETFAVSFSVKDSLVVRKDVAYGIGLNGSFHPSLVSIEEQEHWPRRTEREPLETGWGSTDLYRYYQFGVRMTPKVSVDNRRRYTSFNFNCFWKYKGCNDARELLPTADPPPF